MNYSLLNILFCTLRIQHFPNFRIGAFPKCRAYNAYYFMMCETNVDCRQICFHLPCCRLQKKKILWKHMQSDRFFHSNKQIRGYFWDYWNPVICSIILYSPTLCISVVKLSLTHDRQARRLLYSSCCVQIFLLKIWWQFSIVLFDFIHQPMYPDVCSTLLLTVKEIMSH